MNPLKFLSKFLYPLLALLLMVGTLTIESISAQQLTLEGKVDKVVFSGTGRGMVIRQGKDVVLAEDEDLLVGDVIKTEDQKKLIIFGGNGFMRMAPYSEMELVMVNPDDGYIFKLLKGRVWMNAQFITKRVNFLVGNTMLLPQHAAFDVNLDQSKMVLKSYTGHVGVGLLPLNYKAQKVLTFKDAQFINSLLVVQGSQAVFFADNIANNADILAKLLYSKLIKEFQYTLVAQQEWQDDDWLKVNIQEDKAISSSLAQHFLTSIRDQNLNVASLDSLTYQSQKAFNDFANTVTFSAEKVEQRKLDVVFNQLKDAEYLLVFGRTSEAKERLITFKRMFQEILIDEPLYKGKLFLYLEEAYEDLRYVFPEDPLFEVKSAIVDMVFKYQNDKDQMLNKFLLLRDYLYDVYQLADSNPALARLTFEQYFDRLTELLKKERTSFNGATYLLAEENQIVDNLFRQFPVFYTDTFFTIKHTLESEWLSFLPEGHDKDEERQTIMSVKIEFLKKLQTFLLEGKVTVRDARLVAFRLINEIKEMQTFDDVGISELFKVRLKDYGQFLRFLNSTDIGSFKVDDLAEKYQQFLVAQKEEVSIEEAVQEFLNEKNENAGFTVEKILNEAKKQFEAIGVEQITFQQFSDSKQRLITVETALYKGVNFTAVFDWDRGLISQVQVEGKLISQDPIRLENLPKLLLPSDSETITLPVPVDANGGIDSTSVPKVNVSKTERVTKILLLQKLKAQGITAAEDAIEVTDKAQGVYTIKDGTLLSDKKVKLTFVFNNKTNTLTSLTVITSSGEQKIDGELALDQVIPKIKDL